MSRPYPTTFDSSRSPMDSSTPTSALNPNNGIQYNVNVNRNKTKRWVEAPAVDYESGWGDDYSEDDYPPQKSTGAQSQQPSLQRKNSFERGDDGVSPGDRAPRSAAWDLPPTPAELEQQERERRMQYSRNPANVPTINVPGDGRFSGANPAQPNQPVAPREEPTQYGIRETVPPPFGVAPDPPMPVRSPEAVQSQSPPARPYGNDRDQMSSASPAQVELPKSPQQYSQASSPRVGKPMPPPPPPEDNTLETISEASLSGGSSPKDAAQMQGHRQPHGYEEFDQYSGYGVSLGPTFRQAQPPASLSPQQQQSPPLQQEPFTHRTTVTTPPLTIQPPEDSPPPQIATASPIRIVRPADIYKRHQEEMRRKASQDSSGPSMESLTRPTMVDTQRPRQVSDPPTPVHQRQQIQHQLPRMGSRERVEEWRQASPSTSSQSGSRGRDPNRPPSRDGPRPRSSSRGTASHSPYHTPVGGLPPVPGSPLTMEYPPERGRQGAGRAEVSIEAYAPPSKGRSQQPFIPPPRVESRGPGSGGPPRGESPSNVSSPTGQNLQNVVTGAFKRTDTLQPTPISTSSSSGDQISPILSQVPPPSAPLSQGYGSRAPQSDAQPRVPSPSMQILRKPSPQPEQQLNPPLSVEKKQSFTPDAKDIAAKRSSTPITITPAPPEPSTGELDRVTPSSSAESTKTDEGDELSVFIGELKRANTPTHEPDSGPTTPRATGINQETTQGQLGVPESKRDPRESVEVFSFYDSYWNDTEEPPLPPPPIQLKSPLRASPSIDAQNARKSIEDAAEQKNPSPPPPVVIPEKQKESEPPTPSTIAETPDGDMLALFSARNRFLNRRDTTYTKDDENARTPTADKAPPNLPTMTKDAKGIQAIHETKPLGPESEGLEVIKGPTIEQKPTSPAGDEDPVVENEYARELLNQFTRPQTLMLKETMLLPSGTQIMPPMPPVLPLDGKKVESAPDAVNFDKDDENEKEVAVPHSPPTYIDKREEGPKEQPKAALSAFNEPSITPPPPPPPPSSQTPPVKEQPQRPQTARLRPGPALFQDPKTIASLSNACDRSRAYDNLREHLIQQPNELQQWVKHQMDHNHGQQLLETQLVHIKPGTAAGLKKSKSKIALPHLPHHNAHYDQPMPAGNGGNEQAHHHSNTNEKLERLGLAKGANKIGGWMKKVKKGHGSKDSGDAGDTCGPVYVGDPGAKGQQSQNQGPLASTVSLVNQYTPQQAASGGVRKGSVSNAAPTISRPTTASQGPTNPQSPPVPTSPQMPQQQQQPPPLAPPPVPQYVLPQQPVSYPQQPAPAHPSISPHSDPRQPSPRQTSPQPSPPAQNPAPPPPPPPPPPPQSAANGPSPPPQPQVAAPPQQPPPPRKLSPPRHSPPLQQPSPPQQPPPPAQPPQPQYTPYNPHGQTPPPQHQLHLQTQFQTQSAPSPSGTHGGLYGRPSLDDTRQNTPNQYYKPNLDYIRHSPSPHSPAGPPSAQHQQFPRRTDSLFSSQTTPQSPAPRTSSMTSSVRSPFPHRGENITPTTREGSVITRDTHSPSIVSRNDTNTPSVVSREDDDDDLYSVPKPTGQRLAPQSALGGIGGFQQPHQHHQQHQGYPPPSQQYPNQSQGPTPPPPQGSMYGPPQQQMQDPRGPPPRPVYLHGPPVLQPTPGAPHIPTSAPVQPQQQPPQQQPQQPHPPQGAAYRPFPQPYPTPVYERSHQQPPPQPPSSPPAHKRNASSSFMKSISNLTSSNKDTNTRSVPPGSSGSGDSAGKKDKAKRSSFLGGLKKSDSVSSGHETDNSGAPEKPKMVKHGSLLTKLGEGRDKKEKEGKHKKGFSMDLFSRSASTSGIPSKAFRQSAGPGPQPAQDPQGQGQRSTSVGTQYGTYPPPGSKQQQQRGWAPQMVQQSSPLGRQPPQQFGDPPAGQQPQGQFGPPTGQQPPHQQPQLYRTQSGPQDGQVSQQALSQFGPTTDRQPPPDVARQSIPGPPGRGPPHSALSGPAIAEHPPSEGRQTPQSTGPAYNPPPPASNPQSPHGAPPRMSYDQVRGEHGAQPPRPSFEHLQNQPGDRPQSFVSAQSRNSYQYNVMSSPPQVSPKPQYAPPVSSLPYGVVQGEQGAYVPTPPSASTQGSYVPAPPFVSARTEQGGYVPTQPSAPPGQPDYISYQPTPSLVERSAVSPPPQLPPLPQFDTRLSRNSTVSSVHTDTHQQAPMEDRRRSSQLFSDPPPVVERHPSEGSVRSPTRYYDPNRETEIRSPGGYDDRTPTANQPPPPQFPPPKVITSSSPPPPAIMMSEPVIASPSPPPPPLPQQSERKLSKASTLQPIMVDKSLPPSPIHGDVPDTPATIVLSPGTPPPRGSTRMRIPSPPPQEQDDYDDEQEQGQRTIPIRDDSTDSEEDGDESVTAKAETAVKRPDMEKEEKEEEKEEQRPRAPSPGADEKIATFSDPDHSDEKIAVSSATGGVRDDNDDDDDDGRYKMSATALPGQAWEPEFYGY